MIDLSEWISVNDQMPIIPEGKHSITVLCSVHDPVYEECCPGKGSDVQTLNWNGKSFKTIAYGGNGSWGFHEVVDIVTHWMYKPKAFQITNDGFKFDPKGYNGYLPVDYEPTQEAIDNARNMTNWFNAYQDIDDFLKNMLKGDFPIEGDTPQHNTIRAIKLLIGRVS